MTTASVDFFRTAFDYTFWCRDRILGAAKGLTEADYTSPCGLDYPSIRATLAHWLGSEIMLLNRWRGTSGRLTEADVPTVAALREAWRLHERALRSHLASLTDADLEGRIEFTNRTGATVSEVLWQSMLQSVTHSTQHRSEIALALTQKGHSPGGLDFAIYVRERLPV
jgi:uncharacterized damage-inducible protein DinB